MQTHYEVFVQDASRTLVGIVDAYDQFSMIPRFNAVGSWALSLDANHPMATFLKTRGYGIYVNRYVEDDTGVVLHADQPFFSGPMRNWSRENQSGVKTLTVSGANNLIWIAMRDAWPVTDFPYDGLVTEGNTYGYWTFGDTSGTTAAGIAYQVSTDTTTAVNGAYHGGFTLGQSSGLDDIETGVLFDGSSGYMDAGVTGVGDHADPQSGGANWANFCVHGWFNPVSLPSGTNKGRLAANSAPGTSNKGISFYIDNTGTLIGFAGNGASSQSVSSASGAIATGSLYHAAFQYDGSTLAIYLNGVKVATHAFSGNVPADGTTTMKFGREAASSSNFFHGMMAKWEIVDGFFPDAEILNFYQTGISRFAENSIYTNGIGFEVNDLAENVIWDTVNNNAGPGAITSRQVSGLSMATNGHNGSTVTVSQRFDNLIAKDGTGVLQTAALASSPELGFKVTQSGTALTFAVYVPNDLTSNVIFSDELGNLGDVTYEVDAPDFESEFNMVVVGGAGSGTTRAFYLAQDTTSVSAWGRTEGFVDDRNASDAATLATDATSNLLQFAEKVTFSAQLLPTSGMVYGIDFGLGDKVTCVLDGAVVVQDLVREVQIDLSPDSGEVVTIAVGTPGAVAMPSGNPSITGRFYGPTNAATAKHGKQPKKHLKGHHHARHLKRQAKAHHKVQARTSKLERRY